ncbi:MAG TPA: hypothetical protein VGQ35_16845 [Dongiaceae bacterium]|jgi:hypothetical protein|nr:hypothetical protein [Dongiaceae bacterium]
MANLAVHANRPSSWHSSSAARRAMIQPFPYSFRAVIASALMSTLIAPTLYYIFIGEPGDLPWPYIFIAANTFGLPVVGTIFLVTCAILWILNMRGVSHIAAYCLCGAGLGTWAPLIGGWVGFERHFGSGDMPLPYGSFFAGAMAGCLAALAGNLLARVLSPAGQR